MGNYENETDIDKRHRLYRNKMKGHRNVSENNSLIKVEISRRDHKSEVGITI